MRRFSLVVVVAFFLAASAYSQCSTTVTVAVDEPSLTAQIGSSMTGPSNATKLSFSTYWGPTGGETALRWNLCDNSPTCTGVTDTVYLECRVGSHTARAEGLCEYPGHPVPNTQTTDTKPVPTFTTNPTVTLTFNETTKKAVLNFDFPGTINANRRYLELYLNGKLLTWWNNLAKNGSVEYDLSSRCGGDLEAVATTCGSLFARDAEKIPWTCPLQRQTCPYTPSTGEPINIASRNTSVTVPLLAIDDPVAPIAINLTYNSTTPAYKYAAPEFAYGWTHSFSEVLTFAHNTDMLYHIMGDGTERFYTRVGTSEVWQASLPRRDRATATKVGEELHVTDLNGTLKVFDYLTGVWRRTSDRWGNTISGSYSAGKLTTVTDAAGRAITFTYTNNLLSGIALWDGKQWRLEYNGLDLTKVFDPVHTGATAWRTFSYDNEHRLTEVRDDAGALLEGHTYNDYQGTYTSYIGQNKENTHVLTTAGLGQGVVRVTHDIESGRQQIRDITIATQNQEYLVTNGTGSCQTCAGGDLGQRTYDASNQLLQVTADGVTTTYSYDTNGQLLTTTTAPGTAFERITTNTYGHAAWPSFVTQETRPGANTGTMSITRSWSPDERTLTTTTTGKVNGTNVTYTSLSTFDARHRILSIDGPRTDTNDIETRTYYGDNDADLNRRGRLQTITSPNGLTTTFDNYDVYGTARTITDPNGVVTNLATDARGRIASTTLPALALPGETTAYTTTATYDTRDRLIETTTARGFKTTYTYEDGSNYLLASNRLDVNSNQIERRFLTRNLLGWITKEEDQTCTTPAPVCGSWLTRRVESFTYDNDGRLTTTTHADNTTATHAYDSAGRLASTRDENHATPNTTYGYDLLGRLTTVTQTLAGTSGAITRYSYDQHDNLASVTDPNGNITTYRFDDFDRLEEQVSAVTGTTTYAYDGAGNLTQTTDANGATTARTYDAENRVTSAVATRSGAPTETVTWAYDDPTAGRFGKARLTSTADPSGTTAYEYERRGLLRRETKTIQGQTYIATYAHDASGNRSSITYPSGREITYAYDYADRPVSASANGTTLVSNATYLPFGPLAAATYGSGGILTRSYDQRYRLTTNQLMQGGSAVAQYTYAYDAAGNITAINDTVIPAYNRTFAYDDLHRLTTANTGSGLWGTGSHSYDLMGNLLSLELGTARSASFTYQGITPKLSQVTQDGVTRTMAYDAAGNETAVGSQTLTYSPRNTFAAAGARAFQYDGRGIRAVTTQGTPTVSLTSLAISPMTVVGDGTATGTITLSQAPPAAVTIALTSSDAGAARPPALVTIPAGATSAPFTITSVRPIATTTALITASHDGSTATGSLTVERDIRLASVSLSPTSLTGAGTSTGTLLLDTPAGTGGATVALTSSHPTLATVPANVTVASGGTTATFTVTAAGVGTDTNATITGTLIATRTATLTLIGEPVDVTTLAVAPSTVVGGYMHPTGTVTLNRQAPTGGVVVTFGSSDTTKATVPTNVTIPANTTGATFTVTTSTAGATTPVNITATYTATRTAAISVCSCTSCPADAPTLGAETVWFEDALPAGASPGGTWTWDTVQKVSGTQSHTNPPSTGHTQRLFTGATTGLTLASTPTDRFVAYVLLDPCNPPRELMLQLNVNGSWEQRAYWGENLIGYGTNGTNSRRRIGDLPPVGVWTRLEVPAGSVGLCDKTMNGMAFDVYGGKAWFDRVGKVASGGLPAPPASFPSTDTVWFDDALPTGASAGGTWNWDTTYKASGTQSNTQPGSTSTTQRLFTGGQGLALAVGEKIILYALLSECEVPREIMLQFNDGSWEHRAYWGENLIGYGTNGTNSRRRIGDLPTAGQWVRLEVPVADVGLVGRTITGLSIDVYGGKVWIDRVSKAAAQSGALFELPATMISASLSAEADTATFGNKHSLYTPELQLMAETNTSATPAVAYEYVWFNGEPLAQVETTTGAIHYYFNDHLGAPLLTTNSTGTVDWRVEREPFGEIFAVRAGGDRHQPLGLPGQEYDPSAPERQYNVFRWIRNSWGRYTQADPLGLEQDTHLYAYALQNPLAFVDPLGLAAELICKQIAPGGLYIPFLFHCRIRAICDTGCKVLDDTFGMEATGEPYGMRQWPVPQNLQGYYIRRPVSHPGVSDCDFYKCLRANNKVMGKDYRGQATRSVPAYKILGPNSNSYARKLLDTCGGDANFPRGATGRNDRY